jgi:4-hydroxy-tetrahydrodipicolinate synthase
MSKGAFHGIVTPILTPYNDDQSIARDLYLANAAWQLENGADYISPFGTTGEAVSNGMQERMSVLEDLVETGNLPPSKMMPGTGVGALPDTIALTRHAVDLGCAAAMVLPPHYYAGATTDEGLYRYFSDLIEGVGSDALRICLYHIPQMTGVAMTPALSARLNTAFPDIVTAYKDSSGNWQNTLDVLAAAPGLAVFPASETRLAEGSAVGIAGCISATCNTNIKQIRQYQDHILAGETSAAEKLTPAIDAHRMAVQNAGLIPALKSMMAAASGEARWLNLRAPMDRADPSIGVEINKTLNWSL